LLIKNNSIWNYRYSQCLAYNKAATVKDLQTALSCIEDSLTLKNSEKLFKNQTQTMLKSMNVHNTAEAYDYQLKFVRSQLKNKISEETDFLRGNLQKKFFKKPIDV
jgi:hypothetical protein